MTSLSLEQIAHQLDSENSKDRLLALASLREIPAEDAVPLIKKVLNDYSASVRSMAVFALGIKQTSECYGILTHLLESDPDYGIRADAAGALGYLEDERAFEPLSRAYYEDTHWLVRFSAVVSLGNLKDMRAKDILLSALKSPEIVIQQAGIAALGEIKAFDTVEQIANFITSEDWLLRQRVAEALGHLKGEKAISALKFLTKDIHPQVSEAAQISLKHLEG